MIQKKRGLGKGLSDLGLQELLGHLHTPTPTIISNPTAPSSAMMGATLTEVPLDMLSPGRYQPRTSFSEAALNELAESIRAQGILQPIVVRPHGETYEIIAGERRARAAKLAGLTHVPIIVKAIDDQAALAIALIENIQRQDLNALEEAVGLQRLIDEFHLTHQEVAAAVSRSRTAVTNLLRLLKLNPDVQVLIEHGQLDMGHARALLALTGNQQSEVAQQVVTQGWSVRETEKYIQQLAHPKPDATPPAKKAVDPNIRDLEHRLCEHLHTRVKVRHHPKGHGHVIIQYADLDTLEDLLAHMRVATTA